MNISVQSKKKSAKAQRNNGKKQTSFILSTCLKI